MDDQATQPIEDLDVESHELRETAGVPDEATAEQAPRGKAATAPSADDDGDDVEGHRAYRNSDAGLKQDIHLI